MSSMVTKGKHIRASHEMQFRKTNKARTESGGKNCKRETKSQRRRIYKEGTVEEITSGYVIIVTWNKWL